jgi:hypothetical protein
MYDFQSQGSTAWPEHLRPFVDAHSRYEQALAQAATDERRTLEKITLDYWVALNTAQSDAQKIREAYDQHQANMEREQAAALERRRSSYRDYVLAVQSSWASADADQYDPTTLHMIGSSLQVVAAEYGWTCGGTTARGDTTAS